MIHFPIHLSNLFATFIISLLYLIPCTVSFIPSPVRSSGFPTTTTWTELNSEVDQFYRGNFIDTHTPISLEDFDQYLYDIRLNHSADYEIIAHDSFGPTYNDTTRPHYRAVHYTQYFLGFTGRSSSVLKNIDLFNLLMFKLIFDKCSHDGPTGLFIDHLKVLINHIPDLKATCYRDNFSVLSLLAHDKKIFKLFRGRLDRPELEYNTYFEPLKSVFRTAGGREALNYNLDLKPYLLSLALFTPQIQLNVIRECMSICSNSKNVLLHLILIYRLDEQVFDYLVMDLGANLYYLTFSKNTNCLESSDVFLDTFDSIPSYIFSDPSIEYTISSKLFYLIPESTTRYMSEATKELSSDGSNEKSFVCGMRESRIISRNATSFTSAFYHYSERIPKLLIEMTPSVSMKNDLIYHFYHLMILSSSQKYPPERFTFDKDHLKFDHFITRFSKGIPDIVAVALLSKNPEALGLNEEEVIGIVHSYTLNRKNKNKAITSAISFFKDTADEVVLAACKYNLNPEAFKILTATFSFYSCPIETIESLLHEISTFKSDDFSDKIAFLQENITRLKSNRFYRFNVRVYRFNGIF